MTRTELSLLLGEEVIRDVITRHKRVDLVAAGPRMPAIGAPLTYVTTGTFLSVFGFGSLRDLPDIGALDEARLLEHGAPAEQDSDDLDNVFGLTDDEDTDLDLAGATPDEE